MDVHVPYLEASIADARDDTLVLGRLGVPERRADRPPDRAVLHLELVPVQSQQPWVTEFLTVINL